MTSTRSEFETNRRTLLLCVVCCVSSVYPFLLLFLLNTRRTRTSTITATADVATRTAGGPTPLAIPFNQ